MLKGVNRMVLEVNQPENKYFEKMIFFVRPEFSGLSDSKLREQAKHALSTAQRPVKSKRERNSERLRKILQTALAAGAGAGITAIIELMVR
ncbi:MAG: hypothetical protein J1E34_04005 [Oscillospiraceae bacterium]|nr:hypothetical protein [Oscillospiraceae bacterium]